MEWKARHEYRSICLRFASLASSILSDTGVYSGLFKQWTLCLFFFSALSLSPASVLVSGECTTLRPAVCTIGERAEVKGGVEEGRVKGGGGVDRARHNKYNGWASSWRESPGDFAGFCN